MAEATFGNFIKIIGKPQYKPTNQNKSDQDVKSAGYQPFLRITANNKRYLGNHVM